MRKRVMVWFFCKVFSEMLLEAIRRYWTMQISMHCERRIVNAAVFVNGVNARYFRCEPPWRKIFHGGAPRRRIPQHHLCQGYL
jgi:hypothetical protein